MLKFTQSPVIWLWSLLAAILGGIGTSGTSWLGLVAANGAGLRVSKPNFQELGIIALSAAIFTFFAYLAKSPLPTLVEEETTTITKTTISTTPAANNEGKGP